MIASSVPVPECLKGRLEFGNREQIEALKAIEREIAEQEERTRKIQEGALRKFRVLIAVSGTVEQEVWAVDKDEAKEAAELDPCSFDVDDTELDLDIYRVEEVTG